jgi:hypothetical protein
MANSVTTDFARQEMARARAGDGTVSIITYMAFGDGGVDINGSPIPPQSTDIGLNNELLRKLVDGHTYPISTTCRYSCRLYKNELPGQKINEIALFDADGNMICKKTMTDKTKDPDMEMVFEIDDEF